MNNLENSHGKDENVNDAEGNKEKEPLPFHNPLNPDNHTPITEEDIENEQKYKEALSERD